MTVIGEALIDLVPACAPLEYRARPGGSPFNVAVGLARLGNPTRLMARLADNAFGRILRAHAEAESIDLSLAPHATEPTSLAVVSFDSAARASYDFYLTGAADWQWSAEELARLGPGAGVLHFGSLASWTPPGSARIHAVVGSQRAHGQALISYDPNVRPNLLGDPTQARATVEASVGVAHIVKASSEDIHWLYAGMSIDHVAAHWLELGASLVVMTEGHKGARAFRAEGGAVRRPGREARVVDTVGAGDAFTAGLLSGLARRELTRPELLADISMAALCDVLDEAILVSTLTCERQGADPPTALRAGDWTPRKLEVSDVGYPS